MAANASNDIVGQHLQGSLPDGMADILVTVYTRASTYGTSKVRYCTVLHALGSLV